MAGGGSVNASWSSPAWASARPVSDTFAWMIALAPLMLPLANMVLMVLHQPYRVPGAVMLALYVVLMVADRQTLRNAGETPPSLGWALLVPAYLWRRATLLGKGRSMFWVMLLALVPAGLAPLALAAQTPSCETSRLTALRLFNTLEPMKRMGVIGLHIDHVQQLGETQGQTACTAVVQANDGRSYDVDYANIKTDAGAYVRLKLRTVQRL
jgi:hypothetical protein